MVGSTKCDIQTQPFNVRHFLIESVILIVIYFSSTLSNRELPDPKKTE